MRRLQNFRLIQKPLLLGLAAFVFQNITAQEITEELHAKHMTEVIELDGDLSEPIWQTAQKTTNFWQYFPSDSKVAKYQTTVQFAYDEIALYVGIKAEAVNNNFVVSSLRRDFSGLRNDNVTILFDTFSDGTNAFGFGITPYGVRREFLVSSGGAARENYNFAWDVKWQGESKIFDNYFTSEIRIPFTSLKFEEGATQWRVRPYRFNIQSNETSTLTRVPQTQLLGTLAFADDLIFEKPLGKSRTPMTLIPYVNGLAQKDFEDNAADNSILVGGDAKIAIGDGLNLDLTFNPDFSNVEVDDIFTNLTRFELRLPERRQFFIDNSDLFGSFGNFFNEARPFFSRRIGLARDINNNLIQNDIITGVRLSGKLNEDWRLGILNIQTAADESNEVASNNNTMITLQKKIGKRSNIGAFIVNRERFKEYNFSEENDKYNRVFGVDYNLASEDNTWAGRYYLHKSVNPDDKGGNFSAQAITTYNKNNWVFINDWTYVDNDFTADLGFVPRTDIFKMGNFAQRFFFPKNREVINRNNVQLLFINYFRPKLNFKLTDYTLRGTWETEFASNAKITANVFNQYILLTNDFDPTRTDGGTPLPGNESYRFSYTNIEFTSNNTKLFSYGLNTTIGQFFNGNRYSVGGTLGYRWQPWGQFSLNVNYDGIKLPEPYESENYWLITPRMDVTLNKSLFFNTLIQYSNQRENFGINARLQWRFAPLSDLFLVYNDNYNSTEFTPRFRSINLKMTYWLNL
ncbi:carbohydrate binding family 9 domain-containing protein [Flavobacteriaceae bacterium]|nr:carbohydrate binding family 9 domain-containing protein [Flavobacteriaceae bacterium]MDB9779096.1 carbohydrate binding family 9 domain-containing protein [Flavobacteriaceae bacterium]MDB9836483.1 carbohydrate binding family 9 domain-containing protein [Flavobacteriaceae bacterium]